MYVVTRGVSDLGFSIGGYGFKVRSLGVSVHAFDVSQVEAYKAALTSSRAPALHGAPIADQVVLGFFSFDSLSKIARLEYTAKPAASSFCPPPSGVATDRGHPPGGTVQSGTRPPTQRAPSGAGWGAPEGPTSRRGGNGAGQRTRAPGPSQRDFREESSPVEEGPPTPLHTAVLQLAHVKGGRWNYRLKWMSTFNPKP